MYELEIGYTTDSKFNRDFFKKYEYIIIQKSNDIVKAYQSAYHLSKHLNYCTENFFQIIKKSSIEYIENIKV